MAWVSLDGRDDDPWVFWTYVIAAARTAVPELGDGGTSLLEGSTSSTDAVVTALLNDLSALAGEVVVVLDDYHMVSSTEIHEAVRFLVEHLPSNVHLVLAARADPP
jgi:LuxR family maltose regulon positive regulatory protein